MTSRDINTSDIHPARWKKAIQSMRRQRLSVVSVLLISLCVPLRLIGADDDAVKKEESARRLAAMKKLIDSVALRVGNEGEEKLVRLDDPIQRWSNPVIPISNATVFLWTRDSRPIVIAQVAEVAGKSLWQEFQSLTTESFRGRCIGTRCRRRVWWMVRCFRMNSAPIRKFWC